MLTVDGAGADVGLAAGGQGRIPLARLKWARTALEKQKRGPRIRHPNQVLSPGDVVFVEEVTVNSKGAAVPPGTFGLRQVPEIAGGLVALDPHTGRVLAMSEEPLAYSHRWCGARLALALSCTQCGEEANSSSIEARLPEHVSRTTPKNVVGVFSRR